MPFPERIVISVHVRFNARYMEYHVEARVQVITSGVVLYETHTQRQTTWQGIVTWLGTLA
jgi:hypothetical protein